MAASATNLISGPATLWQAIFGATEAADTAVATEPTSPYSDMGGTDDGVTVTVSREYFELRVDQVTMTPSRRRVKTDVSVSTNLAEPTLANLAVALAQPSSSVTSGGTGATAYSALDIADTDGGEEPEWMSVLLRGRAPNGKKRNIIVRKALSTDEIEMSYKKGDQTLIPITFSAHWVSSSIKPVHMVDSTAV